MASPSTAVATAISFTVGVDRVLDMQVALLPVPVRGALEYPAQLGTQGFEQGIERSAAGDGYLHYPLEGWPVDRHRAPVMGSVIDR